MKYSIGTIVILILLSSCRDSQSSTQKKNNESVNAIIPSKLTSLPGTSISIGVIRGEDVQTYHRSYGEQDLPNDSTFYEMASITKVFTGLLSAKAVNDSLINLDAPFTKYLPDKELPDQFNKITVRNLLTHRAGLPLLLPDISERLVAPDWVSLAPYYNTLRENYSTDEFFNDLRNLQLPPSEEGYSYSNIGANLMGYCLSSVYDQSFECLLKEKIFVPLGMSHTYIGPNKNKPTQGWRDGTLMPLRSSSHINADGGIVSCVSDMISFIKFNLKGQLPEVRLSQSTLSTFEGEDVGYFWHVDKNKIKTLYHPGGSFGTTSLLMIRPQTKSGVFIVTNQAGPQFHSELRKIAENLLDSNK